MSFQFRLDTLRKLREQTRDERRGELAQALEAERVLQTQLGELQGSLQENHQTMRNLAQRREVNVDSLANSRRYEALLQANVASLQQQLQQVREEMERRRLALMEADREVRVLEKLRERQLATYTAIEDKRESQRLDAVALRGFVTTREASP